MSIHNSKGLDFPIVFVPLTDYEIRRSGNVATEIVHDWSTGVAGLKVNWITEPNYLKLKYGTSSRVTDEPVLEDEEKRVLYVAATRAKKEIFFCCLENGSGKEVLEMLSNLFPFLPVTEEESASALQQIAAVKPEYQPLQPVLDQWEKLKEVSLLRAEALVDSVTSEAEKLEPGEVEIEEIAARAKLAGGTLVGLLCHGVLERWDFQSAAERSEIEILRLLHLEKSKYSRNFSRNQIDRAAAASAEILLAFVNSEASKWLRSVEIVGREVPIVYFDRESRKILSGKIDLLVKEEENYVIVDYKTDRELTDPMLKRYAEQMRLYGVALSESTGMKEITKKLLLVRTGEIIDV
jgi:ATP-dependent exoDNAse (exonuclease V) beta subunit